MRDCLLPVQSRSLSADNVNLAESATQSSHSITLTVLHLIHSDLRCAVNRDVHIHRELISTLACYVRYRPYSLQML